MKLDIIKIDLSKFRNEDSIIYFAKENNLDFSELDITQIFLLSRRNNKYLFFDVNKKMILGYIKIDEYKNSDLNKIETKVNYMKSISDYQKNPELLVIEKVIKNKSEKKDIKSLEIELQDCLDNEDYLGAAKIRDIIKELI